MHSLLHLEQLGNLLSLPCIIKDSIALTDTPILSKAFRKHAFIFKHKIFPAETLTAFLNRIYEGAEVYTMDCSIYAQLAALVLSGKWSSCGGSIKLYICAGKGEEKLCKNKIPQMGYITVRDEEVSKLLMEMSTSAKGEWCIQIETNKFLGLSSTGPKVLSMEEWITHLRTELETLAHDRSWSQQFGSDSLVNKIQRDMLDCYFNLNRLNKWVFCAMKNIPKIKANWTPTGIILKENDFLSKRIFIELLSNISDNIRRDSPFDIKRIIAKSLLEHLAGIELYNGIGVKLLNIGDNEDRIDMSRWRNDSPFGINRHILANDLISRDESVHVIFLSSLHHENTLPIIPNEKAAKKCLSRLLMKQNNRQQKSQTKSKNCNNRRNNINRLNSGR